MKDFVTFKIAKKLKEKGFPQVTFGNYDMQSACYIEDGRFYENGCITEVSRAYTAPTISQVLKWLREEKKLHINVDIDEFGWEYRICKFQKVDNEIYNFDLDYLASYSGEFMSYEQAALNAIEFVLDKLI